MSLLDYSSIAHLIPANSGNIYIAYSGGIDSHVLLHLCASQADLHARITAVYVHHGLQAQADDWAAHCDNQSTALGIGFLCLKVDAKAANGESPEAAARQARYKALMTLIQSDDLVLFAQHREDQMETVLLQLFRGAGVRGLAAMPLAAPFGRGSLIRPLLPIPKSAIREYARVHRLNWVEDPSNQSSDFDRNFLRNQVIPLLKQRWPSLDKTVARSAQHCAEASALIATWNSAHLGSLANPEDNSLNIDKLKSLEDAEITGLLRHWFSSLGLKPPSQALLQTVKQQFLHSDAFANPHLVTQGHVLKKYRQTLYCLTEKTFAPLPDAQDWPAEKCTMRLANDCVLSLTTTNAGISQSLWHGSEITLKPRSGGEKLKLANRAGRHDLKKLFQEAGIPPWERQSRPLIYLNGQLAAVAGLWIAEWACAQIDAGCYRITWQPPQSV
ncbi:tRNA lysidine(34) synthetase TilS [Methylomonas methanica]|uniref:tRNA(Ile)-lysidine synthase n=1 Tax=Methylomonas methanica (strain DSM 25384 / MC09) TaxID=857087 RepID=G0A6Y0_METMM|nr:tRNA lysidine(34) synthetase TilS [Methylomonas methanica]AEG01774.1 tRNA(Ile)-lysidine synthase [Methylomonas methanica MC09]